MRRVGCHLNLVNASSRHSADGGEALQNVAAWISGSWRVHDDAISGMHALKRCLLSMVELDEAAFDAKLYMLSRHDSDPKAS